MVPNIFYSMADGITFVVTFGITMILMLDGRFGTQRGYFVAALIAYCAMGGLLLFLFYIRQIPYGHVDIAGILNMFAFQMYCLGSILAIIVSALVIAYEDLYGRWVPMQNPSERKVSKSHSRTCTVLPFARKKAS